MGKPLSNDLLEQLASLYVSRSKDVSIGQELLDELLMFALLFL